MSTRFLHCSAAFLLLATSAIFADELQPAALVRMERPTGANTLNDLAQRSDVASGIKLDSGRTTLVMRLSATQTLSALSFTNKGAIGHVTFFASSVNLPSNSKRWQQLAVTSLGQGEVKSLVRPSDARYLKVTFELTQAGEISDLGIYAAATVASKHGKDYALLAADSNAVESDGKAIADGKDLGEGKDIPSEGEAPAEGPPPGLPAPPPFTFVPVLVPTSP